MLLPLLRLQQVARPSRRRVGVAFNEGLRFRRDSAAWSLKEKHDWILNRLRYSVRRAHNETVYYRELFSRSGFDPNADFSFGEFSMLPALEREDVCRAGRTLLSRSVSTEQLRKDSTGGSTGMPTDVWLGPEEEGWRESGREHFMQRVGLAAGTRTGMLWGHHLDPVASDRLHDRLSAFVHHIRWFDCFRLSPEVLERYHREFERWQPVCIVGYASALGNLAEHILERGHRPSYPARCFVAGAEKLLPEHREAIENAFGRPVHERYGSRDVGSMGFQLDPARTLDYEIDFANLLIEPETDEPESAILISKLHADGMPMLRYRVGDIGRFPEGSRPGHPSFALQEVVGRDTDRIWLPDGRWITGLQIPHMMKGYPVREFMLVQRANYSVEINIVPENGFGEESRRSIEATVTANLPGLGVTTVVVDEIPRNRANKFRPVVSEIKPPRNNHKEKSRDGSLL
jgi:phenylacetate-CoA ligase